MYYVSKQMEVSACHRLDLPYESKCTGMHGHNWLITVFCKAEQLNAQGMVIDYKHLKEKIHDPLDHKNLNDVLPFNPTAENIARWATEQVPQCYKAIVQESQHNIAVYIDPSKAAPNDY